MAKHIMVVDDDPGILTLLSIMLSRGGFEVSKAQGGLEALTMLNGVVPDMFIVDLMMPELDGFELCRRLKGASKTAKTPILVLSGRGGFDSRGLSMEAGADSYLAKPVTNGDLLQAVGALLRDPAG
jgi:DNA-binding response OmpR family regulator